MRRWASELRLAILIAVAATCPSCSERGSDPLSTSSGPAASSEPAAGRPQIPGPPPQASAPALGPSKEEPEAESSHAPVERALANGRLASLTRSPGTEGAVLDVVVVPLDGASVRARVELATAHAPLAHKASVAYYRLARELDLDLVPVSVVRYVRLAEISSLLQQRRDRLTQIGARLALAADGTVAALVHAEPQPGREVIVTRPPALWMSWATSPVPQPDERASELAGWVGLLVLDYLSGNVLRRSARVGASGLQLVDNATSFPQAVNPRALDRVLTQLREVVRFPRGLKAALQRLDPPRARKVLAPSFDEHLVAPRTLVELDERRVGLLSLIEARIVEHGAEAVLSL